MKHALFEYNGSTINLNDIEAFNTSNRSENDSKNKLRENILAAIINDIEIPSTYRAGRQVAADNSSSKKSISMTFSTVTNTFFEACAKVANSLLRPI